MDYEKLTPFKQLLHRTRRKRELRSMRRAAFDVGSGLTGVDRALISAYVASELHESRAMALGVRLAIDDEFRAYAEPIVRFYEELLSHPLAERMRHLSENIRVADSLPKSPADLLEGARIAQTLALADLPTIYLDFWRPMVTDRKAAVTRTNSGSPATDLST